MEKKLKSSSKSAAVTASHSTKRGTWSGSKMLTNSEIEQLKHKTKRKGELLQRVYPGLEIHTHKCS